MILLVIMRFVCGDCKFLSAGVEFRVLKCLMENYLLALRVAEV
jgi:hypothetical protein